MLTHLVHIKLQIFFSNLEFSLDFFIVPFVFLHLDFVLRESPFPPLRLQLTQLQKLNPHVVLSLKSESSWVRFYVWFQNLKLFLQDQAGFFIQQCPALLKSILWSYIMVEAGRQHFQE